MVASGPSASNSMKMRHFGRAQQMWLLVAACFVMFALFLLLVPGMTFAMWWPSLLAALVACAVTVLAFQWWLGAVLARRDSSIQLLNRITAGDLSLAAREIQLTTQSARMSAAMRALVSNLERMIRRFAQLATDVATASGQISGRSRVLARGAAEQLVSTESTSASVGQIDQTINNVRTSMEELAANAEETSTSVWEMSASSEELSR